MILNTYNKFINIILNSQKRTKKVSRNILLTFLLKGISVIVSFIYVPLLLNFLNSDRYGMWITITSVLAWFSLFDIGIGNSLKNKLAEAIASKNKKNFVEYLSTASGLSKIGKIV